MNYLFQILSGRPIMRNSVDEVLKKIRLQQLGRRQRMKAELELMKLKRPEYLPGIIPPDILKDCINLTKDTVSTLLQIKEKRSAMSQQNIPQITDEMVKAFINWEFNGQMLPAMLEEWERFKKNLSPQGVISEKDWKELKKNLYSHSVSSSEKVENTWEVVEYIHPHSGTIVSGTYFTGNAVDEDIRKRYLIRTVKRLSDGEVFSIGDMCDTFFLGKIEYIRVNGKHCTVGGEKWGCPLQSAKKAPIPEEKPVLFTTEDGVVIREGDDAWVVNGIWAVFLKCAFDQEKYEDLVNHCLFFSTKEAANEYVTMNKPCLNLTEIDEILVKEIRIGGAFAHTPIMKILHSLKQLASSKIEGGK